MTEGVLENKSQTLDEEAKERLREERETFDQHKSHENLWFTLRLVMGYMAVALILGFFIICGYILFNYSKFTAVIVTSASGAFFVDILGLFIAVWKIVLNPNFMSRLAPVGRSAAMITPAKRGAPVNVIAENVPDKSVKDKPLEIKILSARYGMGENWVDVTEKIRTMVSASGSERVYFKVNNDTLGIDTDPTKGVGKVLNIDYTYGNETHSITVREGRGWSLP